MRPLMFVAVGLAFVAPAGLALSQAPTPTATIAGRAIDSLSGQKPLVGASIQLASADPTTSGRTFAATSDSVGKFSFAQVPPGRYIVGFYHPALDSLGIELAPHAVDVRDGAQELLVSTPSAPALATLLCAAQSSPAAPGILLGHLHDAQTESGIVGARVTITWTQPTVANGAVTVGEGVSETTTRGDGWFFACGLPVDRDMAMTAGRATDSVSQTVRLQKGFPLAHFSVYLGAARRGTARVTGKIVDDAHRPIRAARIRADVSDSESVSSIDGSFALERLPAGTHVISVRAIGFSARDSAIKLDDGATATMELSLAKPTVLSAVVTRAAVVEANTATFEEHKRKNTGGFFVQPVRVEGSPAMQTVTQLIVGLPKMKHLRDGNILFPGLRPNTFCTPTIFVNSKKAQVDSVSEISNLIDPDDIIGVEVYTRQSEIPFMFVRPADHPCGVLALWTKGITP